MIPVWPPKGLVDAGDSQLMAALGWAILRKGLRRRNIREGKDAIAAFYIALDFAHEASAGRNTETARLAPAVDKSTALTTGF